MRSASWPAAAKRICPNRFRSANLLRRYDASWTAIPSGMCGNMLSVTLISTILKGYTLSIEALLATSGKIPVVQMFPGERVKLTVKSAAQLELPAGKTDYVHFDEAIAGFR